MKHTPLFEQHQKAHALMVPFGGWHMPLHYGSQVQEHHFVREAVGMFDVSHMTIVDFSGADAFDFLSELLANDVARLKSVGQALYTTMLTENGGIVDDLIVYRFTESTYRIVFNAATREADWEWVQKHIQGRDVKTILREDLAILAIQGPHAATKMQSLFPEHADTIKSLKPFRGFSIGEYWIARTGYTGEDGFEIMLPNNEIVQLWDKALAIGVHPCGLGARDTLRLEAGLNLYGVDMDLEQTPLSSNIAWTVSFERPDRDFIGKQALLSQAQQAHDSLVGIVLCEPGVLRNHLEIESQGLKGMITSGSFSPTLGVGIAMARVPSGFGPECEVAIRNRRLKARVVELPFVRKGCSLINDLPRK